VVTRETSKTVPAPGSLEGILRGTAPEHFQNLSRARADESTLVSTDDLQPNPWQYRSPDPEWIEELAQSIASKGQLEAITYRTSAAGAKQIIGGHCRWAAMRLLRTRATTETETRKYEYVLASEKMQVSDLQMEEFGIIDNLFRKDPSPVETAAALARYRERENLSPELLAERFNLRSERIRRLLTLNSAPEVIKEGMTTGLMIELVNEEGEALTTSKGRPRREHRRLDLMQALELSALHNALTKHAGPDKAKKRVESLVTQALKKGCTFQALQALCRQEKDKFTAKDSTRAATDDNRDNQAERNPVFVSTRRQLVIHRLRISTAEATEKQQLCELLDEILHQLREDTA